MPDHALLHRPALAAVATGRFGANTPGGPGATLRARPEGRVLHVLGAPGAGALGDALANQALGTVRCAGPGQWFIVADAPAGAAVLAGLSASLGDRAAVADQSHGRVRIAVDGPRAADLLAKGTAVDLHPDAFPPGRSTMTLVGRIAVNLARDGDQSFELIVQRGFAESLWKDLLAMGLEFGVACEGPPATA
jgi:sarcosine oxidase, subunit gamma